MKKASFTALALFCLSLVIFFLVFKNIDDNLELNQCDAMEEARLKVALNQCSDLVMNYAWDDWSSEKEE